MSKIKTRFRISEFISRSKIENPSVIEFLSNHREIEKYISIITVAEAIRVLKYDDDFRRYKLDLESIKALISKLQEIVGFSILEEVVVENRKFKGIIVTPEIIKFIDKHEHLIDCIHIDIAKFHELTFISNEEEYGELKALYPNIMTANKLIKQYE